MQIWYIAAHERTHEIQNTWYDKNQKHQRKPQVEFHKNEKAFFFFNDSKGWLLCHTTYWQTSIIHKLNKDFRGNIVATAKLNKLGNAVF